MYDLRKGWIQVEDKELTKHRLGRSPDAGDAVMLSFASSQKKKFSFISAPAPVVGGRLI
jgi:hypothetical protein